MKKALKIAGVLAVLALLAGLAAPLLLKQLLPPERLRALVIKGARKSLGREVKLEGVTLGLLSGLTLRNLSISERPDFSAGTFAAVDAFSLKVKLAPLLRRKLVVDTVAASGLALRVVKSADGTYNFSDLLTSSAAAKAGGSPESPAPAPAPASESSDAEKAGVELAISSLRLEDAKITYVEGSERSLTLSELQAKVAGFALTGGFTAEVSGRSQGRWDGRALDGTASFAGKLDLGGSDPRLFRVEAKRLEAESGGWKLSASGRLADLSRPDVDAELELRGPSGPIGSARFKGLVTPATARTGLAVEGSASVKTSALSPSAASTLKLPAGMPFPAMKAEGEFAYAGDALRLKALKLETPFGPIAADGSVNGLTSGEIKPALDLTAKLDLPPLRGAEAAWLHLPAGMKLPAMKIAGKAQVTAAGFSTPGLAVSGAFGKIDLSGSARRSAAGGPELDLAAVADVQVPSLRASDMPWANLPEAFVAPALSIEGRIALKGDDLLLSPLKLRGSGGTVEVSGAVRGLRSGAPEPALDAALKLSLPPLKSSDDPFGRLPEGLSLPASRWDGGFSVSRDEVKIRSLRAVVGGNDVEIENGRVWALRTENPAVSLTVKCRQFQLEELTAASEVTRDMELRGSGFFALSLSGRLPRPVLEGKAQFKDVGMKLESLKLARLTGTASFNESIIDVPNLRGNVADGQVELNLTVKNYTKAPDVALQATLTEFDLGKFLEAQRALAARKEARARKARKAARLNAAAAVAEPKAAVVKSAETPAPPMSSSGKLTVGRLIHTSAEAHDVRLDWSLSGITPEMRKLSGTAKLFSSGGTLDNLLEISAENKVLKVLMTPLIVIQKLGLFPVLKAYSELAGDYVFRGGIMTVRDSHMIADRGSIEATGDIDLPKEALDLTVRVQLGRVAPPIEVAVGGSFDKPTKNVKVGKAAVEGVKNLLENILKPR